MTNQTEKTTEEEIETIRRDAAREVEVARKAAEAWAERARRVESTTGTVTDPLIPGGADLAGLAARESMSAPEPPPQPGKHDVAKWLDEWLLDHGTDDARELVQERILFGLKKYGTRLQSHNGRDPLEDARQEIGDALQYVAQCHLEVVDVTPLFNLIDALYDLTVTGNLTLGEPPEAPNKAPHKTPNKPTRLELQARGLLDSIECGDWVTMKDFDDRDDTIWEVTKTSSDGVQGRKVGDTSPGLNAKRLFLRLATPTELLNAGIIDEIPNSPEIPDSSPVDVNGEVLEVGDGFVSGGGSR